MLCFRNSKLRFHLKQLTSDRINYVMNMCSKHYNANKTLLLMRF
jgi:hypothetical protein